MANEVSERLTTYAASLNRDYPSWNAYVEQVGSPKEPNHAAWVRLSVEEARRDGQGREFSDAVLLRVTYNARFSWKKSSSSTSVALGILDRAATFMAWLATVDNSVGVMRSQRLSPDDPYFDVEEPLRREILVRWTVEMAVNAAYEGEGIQPPAEGAVVTRLIIDANGERQVYTE